MQNMPGKKRKMTKTEDRHRILTDAWHGLAEASDAFNKQQTELLLQALRQTVSERLMADISRLARLGDYDERMYLSYERLMDTYRETAAICDTHKHTWASGTVKNILDGICAVLVSRLKQFEDASGEADENPITTEKAAILQKASAYFETNAAGQARFFTEKQSSANGSLTAIRAVWLAKSESGTSPALSAVRMLSSAIEETCFTGLYTFYCDALKFGVTGINDLEQRKTTQYYYDLIESEMEVLGSIIKIQVQALEFSLAQNAGSTQDTNAVQRVLTCLREGYQFFGRATTEIQKAFGHADGLPVPEPFEAFTQYLQGILLSCIHHALDGAQIPTVIAERQSAFHTALDRETDALFDGVHRFFFKTIYRFQCALSEDITLAEEIIGAFERLRKHWPDCAPLRETDATEYEILNGVAETIQIKIESLNENVQAFHASATQMVNDCTKQKKAVEAEARLEAYHQVLDKWQGEMIASPCDKSRLLAFFEACASLDAFKPYHMYYEKMCAEYAAKIDKALFNFKKEILLYEISTYEEILTYSVSRLRESEAAPVRAAVALLDETMVSLEIQLKKNNIIIIHPAPHDAFNGREHEVLVAEKNDAFKKGEIIKLINNGYKQKDVVILRANVVAAR